MTDRFSDAPAEERVPALKCEGVHKRYGQFVALEDVSLQVARGEIFALLGPNGAGKTTLISCIGGLAKRTSGKISVFGHDVEKAFRVTRRIVGIVPQEIVFDPFFTPLESLHIQAGLMGVKSDRAYAEHLLETFSLADHKDAYTRNLSGGMKRRLLIAKALIHRPKLLFLDEPTAGVDVQLRKELWSEVERLRDNGTTIVLTTHYMEEAEELADRIAILNKGRLVTCKSKAHLMQEAGSRSLEDMYISILENEACRD